MPILYVIATPIGNLEDITHRAVRTLREVDALACEDTRRTRILLDKYGVPKPRLLFSCHERNEARASRRIVTLLREGASVGLCTNAGCPGISDPGYRVISQAIDDGFRVEVIPGPGAVETALLVSGLPTSSYTFKGFPPRKSGRRRSFLAADKEAPHTLVFFESPLRAADFVRDARTVLGDRRAAVCIELTKRFERVHRGFLADLAEEMSSAGLRGEVTIVVAGNHPKFIRD